jgi:hypothetical protein
MTPRDGERRGSEAPDPLQSDLGRTDDVPDVNAEADTGGVSTPNKAVENVE